MAYTTINKSTDYFNTKLYTGTGSSNALTGVGHNPDFVWIKSRADSYSHFLFDAVRGVYKRIKTNSTDAETESNESLKSFDSDGFTLGTQANINNSGSTYASWNWKAGTTSGITQGGASITPSSYSINATAGFSIIKWTGTNANATIPHGLGVAPKMIIIRRLDSTSDWVVYHNSIGNTSRLVLNSTGAASANSAFFNNTSPTSTTFSVGSDGGSNGSTDNYIAYCFAEKTGYSKFGSYTGNENANGTFVYTGFKPAWILVKKSSSGSVQNWYLWDNKRDTFNVTDTPLKPDESLAESGIGAYKIDMLSNGFKFRGTESQINASGATYIYMAFGQSLVGSNNVPCTAR